MDYALFRRNYRNGRPGISPGMKLVQTYGIDNTNTTHTSVFAPDGAAAPGKSAVGGSAAVDESVAVVVESAAVAGSSAAAERRSFAAAAGRRAAERSVAELGASEEEECTAWRGLFILPKQKQRRVEKVGEVHGSKNLD